MTLARHMPYAQSSEHFATVHKEGEKKYLFFLPLYDGCPGYGLKTQSCPSYILRYIEAFGLANTYIMACVCCRSLMTPEVGGDHTLTTER